MRAQSRTLRASGPTVSSDHERGSTPKRLTRPHVGFNPTTPLNAAGWRIEPPVSEPSAPKHTRAATATPEPLEEPPLTCSTFHALRQSPKCSLCPDGLPANSDMLSVPSQIAPAARMRSTTVAVTEGR